jgi:synaptobrevin family protein YKT6
MMLLPTPIPPQHKTIESVLERGEKLDNLVERSNALSAQSKMFYKTAKKVRVWLRVAVVDHVELTFNSTRCSPTPAAYSCEKTGRFSVDLPRGVVDPYPVRENGVSVVVVVFCILL